MGKELGDLHLHQDLHRQAWRLLTMGGMSPARIKVLVTLSCLVLLGLAAARWLGQRSPERALTSAPSARVVKQWPMPPSRVVTVAKLPYGSDPGQMAHLAKHDYEPMKGLFAVKPRAVDDAGYIYFVDSAAGSSRLNILRSAGKIRHSAALPRPVGALHVCPGAQQTVWLGKGPYLFKVRRDGRVLWKLGELREYESLTLKKEYKSLRDPPNSKSKHIRFVEITGLFPAANGGVFVYDDFEAMRRFDANGRLISHVVVDPPPSFDSRGRPIVRTPPPIPPQTPELLKELEKYVQPRAAIAGRDGKVYSHRYATRAGTGDTKQLTSLVVETWSRPNHKTSRTIDLSRIGALGGKSIMLRGVDAKGNLYFQYWALQYVRTSQNYKTPRPDAGEKLPPKSSRPYWHGAAAIAKVGSDNVARQIFDVYAFYRFEKDGAVKHTGVERATVTDCEGLVHVAANGDLYLELETPTHFRIDKISFPQP